ncbi:MAG: DUF1871 family protein [Candidatus Saccharibacteria bacterium]
MAEVQLTGVPVETVKNTIWKIRKMTIYEYFAKWDPMDFIADGAPHDEYDLEAAKVAQKVTVLDSEDTIASKVNSIFVESMEIDPNDFFDECKTRAPDIKSVLFGKYPNK